MFALHRGVTRAFVLLHAPVANSAWIMAATSALPTHAADLCMSKPPWHTCQERRLHETASVQRAFWQSRRPRGVRTFSSAGACASSAMPSWMQRLEVALSDSAAGVNYKALEALRRELDMSLQTESSQEELDDAALAYGSMAAAGIGGEKDESKAEKYLLMAADMGNASAAVYYQLAQLHLAALSPVKPLDVDSYINTGSYEGDANPEQPQAQQRELVSPELGKAAIREIRLLLKEVRVAKGKGAPVKSLRPAAAAGTQFPCFTSTKVQVLTQKTLQPEDIQQNPPFRRCINQREGQVL
jgi:hypothetical protein